MKTHQMIYVIDDPIVGLGLMRHTAAKGERAIVIARPGCGSLSLCSACKKYYEIDEGSMETNLLGPIKALGLDSDLYCFAPAGDIATRGVINAASSGDIKTTLLPTLATQQLLSRKDSFTDLCQRIGVKTPKTYIRSDKQQALELLNNGKACFPLILKPVAMSGGIGVKLVTNDKEMSALLNDDDFDCSPVVIQEYIEGEDVGFSFTAAQGVLTSAYVQHKTSKGWRFPKLDALAQASSKILRETKYSGPGNIDAMLDAEGNVFILEMNARLWATLALSSSLNIDPLAILKDENCVAEPSATPSAIGRWEWDVVNERLVDCSDQYAAMFELSVEEVMSAPEGQSAEALAVYEQDMLDYIHEDDRQRYSDVTEEAYERKQPWTIEFRAFTEAGKELHVQEIGEPQLDASGELIRTSGVLKEIADQKNSPQKLTYTVSAATFTPVKALAGLLGSTSMTKQQAKGYLVSLISDPVGLIFAKVPSLQRAANRLVSSILRLKISQHGGSSLA